MQTHARGPVARLVIAVVTTALALAGLVALSSAAAPGAHAAAGTISGTVRASGVNTPLAGITVEAFCAAGGTWQSCEETTTDAAGGYTFDLPHGTYRIGASSADNQYAAAYFGGSTAADAADVVPPASGIDLAMTRNAPITGKSTQGLLGSPVAGVDVCLYAKVSGGQAGWECVGEAVTATDGSYRLWAKPGTYRVGFSVADNHLRAVFYPNATTVETATDLVIGAGGRPGVTVKMVPNAKVTGHVTVDGSGAAIGGATVRAHQRGPGAAWTVVRTATADAGGTYTLFLDPGTYRLEFDNACSGDGPCSEVYRSEFWDDKSTVETATDVTVGNAGTLSRSAALARNAIITGTITEADGGEPVAGAQVAALRQVTVGTRTRWTEVAWAAAGTDGTYRLHVPTGTYRLSFDDAACDADPCEDRFQKEYWEESTALETAQNVPVTAPGSYAERNGTFAVNGRITGTVTAETGGAPLSGIEVVALDERTYQDGGQNRTEWVPVARATTGADGTYTLPAGAGDHRIRFAEDCAPGECRYLTEYYDDAATAEQGVDVTVAAPGSTTSGIDAALAAGSRISGELVTAGGAPVADATVTVYADRAGSWTPVATTRSRDDGGYAVLLPDGSYRVGFSSDTGAFTEEFYDDHRKLAAADTITVAGKDVPDIDATLGLVVVNVTAPSIADADPQVGETITAQPGTWSVTPDSLAYRWFQSGSDQPIATSKDLVVPAGALGKTLTVEVTAKKAGYADGVASSAPSAPVAQGVLTNTVKPSISGAATVGSTVQAVEGDWSATPDSYTYRWLQSGSDQPIGTGKTLEVPPGAVGKTLTVEVTAVKAGHSSATASSDPSAAVAPGGLANTVKPTITGTVKVGEKVTAAPGTWSPAADSYTYRWFHSGAAEPIGTGNDLVVPAAAANQKLTVEVTASKAGYGNNTVVSEPTGTVARGTITNTAKPTITGDVKVGAKVTATDGTWSPTPATYAYQWFQSGSDTPIGTGKNFTVPVAAAGKTLTVQVAAIRQGYDVADAFSEPSGTVAPGDLTNDQAPSVTGTLKVGHTVTAEPGTWSPTPTGYSYRWFQAGSTDPIGTGKDLQVPAGAAGKALSVEVTATAPAGYADTVKSSAPSAAVEPGDLASVSEPTISGTLKGGEKLTATPGTWPPAADSHSYRWFRSGSDDPIGTAKELTIPGAAAGEKLTVEVTAHKTGYADAVATSEESTSVATGAALLNSAKPTITGIYSPARGSRPSPAPGRRPRRSSPTAGCSAARPRRSAPDRSWSSRTAPPASCSGSR